MELPNLFFLEDKIKIGEEYYEKLSLRNFFMAEEYKRELLEAIKKRDSYLFIDILENIVYLATDRTFLTDLEKDIFMVFEFYEVYRMGKYFVSLYPPPQQSNEIKKEKPNRWTYNGRFLMEWIYMLANKFGWTLEYILDLDIFRASALIQEILVQNQLDREWQYSLTEIAYPYNKDTKKSIYKPLDRPYWMKDEIDAKLNEKAKFRFDMIPQGVTNVSGIEEMVVITKEKKD